MNILFFYVIQYGPIDSILFNIGNIEGIEGVYFLDDSFVVYIYDRINGNITIWQMMVTRRFWFSSDQLQLNVLICPDNFDRNYRN